MRARFLETLLRGAAWLLRALGAGRTQRREHEHDDRTAEARARFWAELREGQREAEATSKPRP